MVKSKNKSFCNHYCRKKKDKISFVVYKNVASNFINNELNITMVFIYDSQVQK